jgi:hypothetical protein
MSDALEILGVAIHPPAPVSDKDAERGVEPRMHVELRVRNATDGPLHVWASRRAFDYDPASEKLVLHLADAPLAGAENPDIVPVSQHPRKPRQTAVGAGEEQTITIPVPTVVRRLAPSGGLGLKLIEEPIGPIRDVEAHVAFADIPFQPRLAVDPHETRKELNEWGEVAVATLPVPVTRRKA